MATTSFPQFDTASVEETIRQVQEINERMIESSKKAGRVALDAYEKALKSMLGFQEAWPVLANSTGSRPWQRHTLNSSRTSAPPTSRPPAKP
jgi:hypothetical protein